ncbi:hypothetical protein B0H34DRAFT_731765, partial [Crassisporium funariophilum]
MCPFSFLLDVVFALLLRASGHSFVPVCCLSLDHRQSRLLAPTYQKLLIFSFLRRCFSSVFLLLQRHQAEGHRATDFNLSLL